MFFNKWLSMNILSIDENTVIVEKEKPLIDLLENTYGFQVVPVDFFDAICLWRFSLSNIRYM